MKKSKKLSFFQELVILSKKNVKWIALSSILDLLFFLGFSWLAMTNMKYVKDRVESVYKIMSEQLTPDKALDPALIKAFTDQAPMIMGYYKEIMQAAGTFLLGFFALWLLLQGASWFIAHKISGHKVKPKSFAKSFTMISAAALALFIVLFFATVKLGGTLSGGLVTLISQDTINSFSMIVFLLVAYLLAIALATLHKRFKIKHYQKQAFSHPSKTAIAFASIIAIIIGLNYLMMQTLQVHYILFTIFTFGIVLPSYTIGRIIWIKLIDSIK